MTYVLIENNEISLQHQGDLFLLEVIHNIGRFIFSIPVFSRTAVPAFSVASRTVPLVSRTVGHL